MTTSMKSELCDRVTNVADISRIRHCGTICEVVSVGTTKIMSSPKEIALRTSQFFATIIIKHFHVGLSHENPQFFPKLFPQAKN